MTPAELSELERMLAVSVMKFATETVIGKDYGGDFPPDAAEYYLLHGNRICMTCDWHPTTDIAQAMMVRDKIGLELFSKRQLFKECLRKVISKRLNTIDPSFLVHWDEIGLQVIAIDYCLAARAWLAAQSIGGDAK